MVGGSFQCPFQCLVKISSEFEGAIPTLLDWLDEHDSELQKFAINVIITLTPIGTYGQGLSNQLTRSEAQVCSKMDKLIERALTWLTFRNVKLRVAALEIALSLMPYGRPLGPFLSLVFRIFHR